jgi:hypothetical protein
MKKIILLLVIVFAASQAFAQTKRIEHRSHSGSNKTFTTKGNSNFGLSPEIIKKRDSTAAKAKDTLAKKADTVQTTKKKKAVKKKKQKDN